MHASIGGGIPDVLLGVGTRWIKAWAPLIAGTAHGPRWYVVMVIGIALAVLVYQMGLHSLVKRRATELQRGPAIPHMVLGIVLSPVLFGVIMVVLVASGAYSWSFSGLEWRQVLGPAIVAAAAAGVIEELIFRGALLQLVEVCGGGSWIALFATSLLFGLIHFEDPGTTLWLLILKGFSGGLLFGTAFLYTRNLWLPIGLHFAWDAVSRFLGTPPDLGVLTFVHHGSDLMTGGQSFEASVVTLAVFLVPSVAFLARARARGHLAPVGCADVHRVTEL